MRSRFAISNWTARRGTTGPTETEAGRCLDHALAGGLPARGLACAWARSHGPDALRRDLLDPWLAGAPPFVISDAFPGNTLPAPAVLPVWWEWPPEQRKHVKHVRWLSDADFSRIQRGRAPRLETPRATVHDHVRLRNSVSRATNSAGEHGELFEVPFSDLSTSCNAESHLTIFARTTGDGDTMLRDSLEMLGRTGYGADASVGHGAFEVDPDLTTCPELDDIPVADGFVALSTFQPVTHDPVEGFWRTFVKYGKLAPELHAQSRVQAATGYAGARSLLSHGRGTEALLRRTDRSGPSAEPAGSPVSGCGRRASGTSRLRSGRPDRMARLRCLLPPDRTRHRTR